MSKTLCIVVAITAIVAPGLHLVSDALEWAGGGFSRPQLVINYLGFIPMPFLMLGLYAVQRPRVGWDGLVGSLLYGAAFVYFTHTTLVALEESIPNYETLWERLGWVYTLNGVLMVVGGVLFGVAALRARVLWHAAVALFLLGIAINLAVGVIPVPDVMQTIGSTVRNLGLMGIGSGLLHRQAGPSNDAT
jgi:hypothetical protein